MLRDVLIQKGLSNREAEVAELVTKGLSNKEVASQLFVTEKTVKFHLTNIYKKMNVRSRAQLIVWCLPHFGFVEKEERIRAAQDMVATNASANASANTNISPLSSPRNQRVIATENQIPAGNTTVGGFPQGEVGKVVEAITSRSSLAEKETSLEKEAPQPQPLSETSRDDSKEEEDAAEAIATKTDISSFG